jgi:hypothetical protein
MVGDGGVVVIAAVVGAGLGMYLEAGEELEVMSVVVLLSIRELESEGCGFYDDDDGAGLG